MTFQTSLVTLSQNHQSYLLRLWKEGEPVSWRASLHNVNTQECHHFANMNHLLSFLSTQLGQAIIELDNREFEPYRRASQKTPVFQT